MSAADDAAWTQYLVHVSACRDCGPQTPCRVGLRLYKAWTAAKAAARTGAGSGS